jgi:hypothetical protein
MKCSDLKTLHRKIPASLAVKMILFLILFFSMSCIETHESDDLPSCLELSDPAPALGSESYEKIRTLFHKVSEDALYFGTGMGFGSASVLARVGWGISLISPLASTVRNECLLLSQLCASVAQHIFAHLFKGAPPPIQSPVLKGVPPSQYSWHLNKMLLSQIPAFSHEEKQLILFLENRWLAKSTGFFPSVVDWICPCFGISVQVHPETTSHYARNPSNKFSQTYKNRVEAWKQSLPHPKHFPLILTRPFDLQDYLPSYLDVPQCEQIQTTVEKLALKLRTADSKVVVDLTHVFPDDVKDQEEWFQTWKAYQVRFAQACKEHHLNPTRILCIQRKQQEEMGSIRLLPLAATSAKEIGRQHRFLLDWISNFGLSANRVELDRCPLPSNTPIQGQRAPFISFECQSKEEFVSYLNAFDQNWKSAYPQKTLMLKGTLLVLKELFANLSEDKGNEIINCSTRSSIVQLSICKIKEQLKLLAEEEDDKALFFDTASQIEQVHANLSSLLEIFSPFTSDDFPTIYRNLLTCIPSNLKPLTSCGVHSSGMTSVAGIFKAVERTLGTPPHVLYGENAYFECITTAQLVSRASSILDATEEDWKQVDLILAQFNPALKRIDLQATEYRVEKIAEALRKSLDARQGKPLTLALDCTLDFIDSPRIGGLLEEFQKEIEAGILNIICYRSGLKFDLFGMDNYCGAPFYMIHNQDSKWASFDSLSTDPVLQTDRLSLNWFCLAYQSAAPQLELYRKQIFDNTRALLNKVPSRLFDKNCSYRIVPVEQGADTAFVDIKISGPFHQIRGAALVGGCLYVRCMEGGHPIFYRPSLGFYHPNFTMIFGKENTTIRLTLGLDPAQVDLLAGCFEMIDTLNDSSWQILLKLLQDPPPPSLVTHQPNIGELFSNLECGGSAPLFFASPLRSRTIPS